MYILGKRLKELRIAKNKLQKEVASELGISITGYSGYENDLRTPGVEMLTKLADYFGVSTDYLLGRENKTNLNKKILSEQIEIIKTSFSDYNNEFYERINKLEKYLIDTK